MKTTIRTLKLLILFCCSLATTAVFGQVTQIWTGGTNGASSGTDIGQATNWGGTLPNTANSDTGQWNGTVPGDLNLVYNTITMASGFGQNGVNFDLTGTQVGAVTIGTTLTTQPTIAIQNIQIESGAGAFTFGGPDTGHVINWVGRPTGAVHTMINNSANVAILTPWIRYTAGGGATWQLDFSGTGNWQVNSTLGDDNGVNKAVQVDGPGTVFWNPVGFLGANGIASPIVINAGALILQNSHPRLSSQAITMNGNFTFAPTNSAAAQTLSGAISGSGTNTISSGTLTLSGQSTYNDDTVLAGGEVIVNGTENAGASGPLGLGTIQFTGGTLGFSVNNVFDYSSRFSTASGQAYNIDTAGQAVTFSNAGGLTGTGNTLTKLGAGTLTLAGPSAYTGLTTVSAGKLVFQGPKSGTGNITVADGASLGVTATNLQVTPVTLTVGTTTSATLEFNNVNSTTTAPLAPTSISAAGTITINVNSGALTPGQSYPLIMWSSGSAPAVNLGILNGFIGNLTTNSGKIQLNVTATAFKWTGLNNGNWDTTTANNWVQNGGPVVFANGGPSLFDDTAITTNVTIVGVVQPSSVTVNNSASAFTMLSSAGNDLGGSASLTKVGNSTLAVSGGANAYSGPTTIGGGTLIVSALTNGGLASDIGAASSSPTNLVIDGGTLQYIGGPASSDHSFSIGLSGGTIDASDTDTLNLTTAALGYSGNGPRTLGLAGNGASNTLAAVIANNGGATALLKNGPGLWALTGNSTYSGLTTINNGVLQIGAGGATGSFGSGSIVDNGRIVFNRTGSLTVSGAISGTGSVTNNGTGTTILAGNNSYTGGTTISAGTVQVGSGGASGNLDIASPVVDNGTLIFNSTSPITIRGFNAIISGAGNVRVTGPGLVMAVGANSYTGWTLIDAGATFQPTIGNEGALVSSVITNNGTFLMTRQDSFVFGYTNNIVGGGRVVKDNNNQNIGDVSLIGTNTYTGGTWIRGGGIIFGDGITTNAGSFVGDVLFTNTTGSFLNPRFVAFNRPDDFTFSNSIQSSVNDGSSTANSGSLVKIGPNVLTLTGTNTYLGATTVGAGVLHVGNGGTIGNIGTTTNGIILTNNAVIIFNRSDSLTVVGTVRDDVANGNGFGTLVQQGPGTLTLSASNTMTGPTVVSNGTLVVSSSVNGDLDVSGGTLVAGGAGVVGLLHVGGVLNIASGATFSVAINKSLSVSNTFVTDDQASINAAAGSTLKIVNVGPSLTVGDKFQFFNFAISGSMSIVSPGFQVANNLASDGSVTVTAILQPLAPTIKAATVVGTNIVITATNNSGNASTYTLLGTNNLTAPLSTWPVVGTGSFNADGSLSVTNPIGTGQRFFILRVP